MSGRSRYLDRDPRWINARRSERCESHECGREIRPGARVFYYPATRSVYCVECSPAVAARAESELADDDTFGGWSS